MSADRRHICKHFADVVGIFDVGIFDVFANGDAPCEKQITYLNGLTF